MEYTYIKNVKNLKEIKNFFKENIYIGFDIETDGLDPYTNKILLYQFGTHEKQYIINNEKVPIENFKEELEDENITYVGHNIKFDLKFLLIKGIIVKKVWDTYIVEQILLNGLEKYFPHKSLDYVCYRHTKVKLDKNIRSNINSKITDKILEYAANDVKYLIDIKNSQEKEAKEKELELAIKLNNRFVPVISYLEISGFKLDKDKWMKKVEKDKKELKEQEKKLNNYIIENKIYKFINKQLNLFSDKLETVINWNSSKQVIEFFKEIGINTEYKDPETGEIKNSVESSILRKYDQEIVELYLKYKELQKRVSTYGENWLEYINKKTGRIHTKFQQWMSTGRMSSGGNDNNIKYPNAQNIPSDDDTRNCIIPEEGNVLIDADYNSQEVRVFANFCNDSTLIEMFKKGYTDMHSYTAWHIYPKIRKKYPELNVEILKKIEKEFPKERKISKLGNFAIQYGGTGLTVAENCNIPLEEGENFYNKYFETFSGAKKYFNWIYTKSKERGYIQYNNVTKEKFYLTKELKDSKVKNYSYNYPIQGTSAAITKLAGVLYWEHLVKENLLFKIKINIICHDEYLIEVPKNIAEREAKILKECMEKAGSYYCQIIPLTVNPVITDHWKH